MANSAPILSQRRSFSNSAGNGECWQKCGPKRRIYERGQYSAIMAPLNGTIARPTLKCTSGWARKKTPNKTPQLSLAISKGPKNATKTPQRVLRPKKRRPTVFSYYEPPYVGTYQPSPRWWCAMTCRQFDLVDPPADCTMEASHYSQHAGYVVVVTRLRALTEAFGSLATPARIDTRLPPPTFHSRVRCQSTSCTPELRPNKRRPSQAQNKRSGQGASKP